MKLSKSLLLALGCVVGVAMFSALPAAPQQKPNVVFILSDNVGYGDLGPYGGGELRGMPTPNADRLAREGLRPHAIPRGALMHPVARRPHDRAIFHPQWAIARRHTGYPQHTLG